MSYDEKTRKHGADKIFLLGLFALSLLIAHSIVKAKKAILLTGPIEIPAVGISVRLPNGNGWHSDERWQHYNDALVIQSVFSPSQKFNLAQVVCTYQLASLRESADDWLRQQAAELGADSPEYGRQQAGSVNINYAYITQTGRMPGAIVATVQLKHGRWLDIEITQMAHEDQMLQQVLEKIAEHLVIKDNELLAGGIETVKQVKTTGLDKILTEQDEPTYYLVKDSSQRNIGFAVDILLESESADGIEIQTAGFAYITRPYQWEMAMLFKSDPRFDDLVWESQTVQNRPMRIRRGNLSILRTQQAVESNNRLLVSNGNLMLVQRMGSDPTEHQTRLSEAAVPDTVIEAVYIQMLYDDTDSIMVDVILRDGRVKPAVISAAKALTSETSAAYVIKTKFIGSDEAEEIYFDSRMQVVKRILRQDGIFVLEPTDMEELVQRFPERADYIIQRTKTLRQDKL